jgi:pimeloyl-ACP methyl ester carboxylesterase
MKKLKFIISLSVAIFLFTQCSQKTGPGVTRSADGLDIHYTVYGKGKTAIVLIHGWMCDQTYWKNQVDQLSENYTVITVDLGGHGESGIDRSGWTLDSFSEDVLAVIRKVHPENIILAGHSMGGFVALKTALRMADNLDGIILVDSFHDIWWPIPDSVKKSVFENYRNNFKNYSYVYIYNSMFPPDADSLIRYQVAVDMSSGPAEVGIGALVDMWSGDYTGMMNEIIRLKVPVILINVELWTTDLEAMKKFGFDVLTMGDVGHFLMLEDPDRFNILFDEALKMIAEEGGD